MHTRGGDAVTPLRVVTASPPRVCIIFLIIQRPVVNYSLRKVFRIVIIIKVPAKSLETLQLLMILK